MIRHLLTDPQRYRAQVERLHLKYLQNNKLYQLQQDGVAFASISFDAGEFSRRVADTIHAGEYQFTPARTRVLRVGTKERLLYAFPLTDLIVHGVVSTIINEAMEPHLSPHLYSYRKGVHWWDAISDLARFVRAHRRARPDVRTRGLYVLRKDVSKYTDSISVGARSDVWDLIRKVLDEEGRSDRRDQQYWQLIENVVRPEIMSADGLRYSNIVGVPTGSPISTTLFNLYLMPVDWELAAIPGGFYARYSDDILFAHADPCVTRAADEKLAQHLESKGLRTNEDKDQLLYFNGAGRQSTEWQQSQGAAQVTFLGCNVSFEGVVSLDAAKLKSLLRDVSARAHRTVDALGTPSPAAAGPIVCAAINETLDPTSHARHKYAPLLRYVVTCRQQLKAVDYQIARSVARALTGIAGVRAFRKVPYRVMREEWGLVSLYHARNKTG